MDVICSMCAVIALFKLRGHIPLESTCFPDMWLCMRTLFVPPQPDNTQSYLYMISSSAFCKQDKLTTQLITYVYTCVNEWHLSPSDHCWDYSDTLPFASSHCIPIEYEGLQTVVIPDAQSNNLVFDSARLSNAYVCISKLGHHRVIESVKITSI